MGIYLLYNSPFSNCIIKKRKKVEVERTNLHFSLLVQRKLQTSPLSLVSVLLVVFSVTPFKIGQNKKSKSFNRLSPESRNRKKVDMQRLSPRFRLQQFFLWKICGETFFPNL